MRYPHRLIPPLVAIAHGSRDPRAAAAVTGLLALARRRAAARGQRGLQARAAFLGHAAPAPAQVLSALAAEAGGPGPWPVIVLPLLLTAAYHSGTDIPAVLGGARARWPELQVRYGAPLGPHPGLLRGLERRLAEAGADLAAAGETAVVLAAAGSSRPAANAVIAGLAAGWQAARGWQAVVPAYASAAGPSPAGAVAALRAAGARRVVVASYLLAPGRFADRIGEQSRAAGAAAVSSPLGALPEVADVLLDRYTAALAPGPRAGARDVDFSAAMATAKSTSSRPGGAGATAQ